MTRGNRRRRLIDTFDGATDHPSAPPTDALGSTDRRGDPGPGLPIVLAMLAGLVAGLAFLSPIPAPVRRRPRR